MNAVREKAAARYAIVQKNSQLKKYLALALVPLAVLAAYVFTVIWRVSVYEQKVFGRSHLIPMSLSPRQFTEAPTMKTYGAFTYVIMVNHKPLKVHKQIINGFQHTFGSALVAYECGEQFADLLFRANEYVEAYLSGDGRRYSHYLDTRKDLYNNMIGRAIGLEARQKNLTGGTVDRYLAARVLNSIQHREVIQHWLEPEVKDLPSLEDYGCPGLPRPSPNK